MNPYLDRFCKNCNKPIDQEKDTYIATLEEDHFPNSPHIPPERIDTKTYKCPYCGYDPTKTNQ